MLQCMYFTIDFQRAHFLHQCHSTMHRPTTTYFKLSSLWWCILYLFTYNLVKIRHWWSQSIDRCRLCTVCAYLEHWEGAVHIDVGSPVRLSCESRISPRRGRQHTILQNFLKIFMKLKKIWTPGWRAYLAPPLDPPLRLKQEWLTRLVLHGSAYTAVARNHLLSVHIAGSIISGGRANPRGN